MRRIISLPLAALLVSTAWAETAAQPVDLGPLDDSTWISGVTLHFRPTYEQSVKLDRLLEDQRNPASPLYRTWLTPQQYGDRFGLSPAEFAAVHTWIVSQGFRVDPPAATRTFISFSGTAAQLHRAFATRLHRYEFDGAIYFANPRSAVIPSVFEPLVRNLRGLDNLPPDARPRDCAANIGDDPCGALHDLARQARALGGAWVAATKALTGSKPGGAGDGIRVQSAPQGQSIR